MAFLSVGVSLLFRPGWRHSGRCQQRRHKETPENCTAHGSLRCSFFSGADGYLRRWPQPLISVLDVTSVSVRKWEGGVWGCVLVTAGIRRVLRSGDRILPAERNVPLA